MRESTTVILLIFLAVPVGCSSRNKPKGADPTADPTPVPGQQGARDGKGDDRKSGTLPPYVLVKPKDGPLGMKFVPLPKGTFYVGGGNRTAGRKADVKEDFEIAAHTVTQGQWQDVMGSNPSSCSRGGQERNRVKDVTDEELKLFPVENVSWNDAQEFIKKLNEKEAKGGYSYRLPSGVEWEYACRAGATSEEDCSYDYYLDKPTNVISSKQANFDGRYPLNNAEAGPNLNRPAKVGSYPPNKLGLYDMHSNVREWCDSVLKTPEGEVWRVMKGGSWASLPGSASDGGGGPPVFRNDALGFRLARVLVRPQ